jgi:hypothetical protein
MQLSLPAHWFSSGLRENPRQSFAPSEPRISAALMSPWQGSPVGRAGTGRLQSDHEPRKLTLDSWFCAGAALQL